MNLRLSLTGAFFAFTFLISPFVDSLSGLMILNGVIPEGGAGSPSQLLRLIILVLGLLILLRCIKYFYTTLALLFCIVIWESVFAFFHNSGFGFIIGIVYGSKIAYVLIVFLTLRTVLDIQFYVVSTALLLIVPFVFGVGFPTYLEGTFGVKGFFSAGNGLGIFLGVGLLLLIHIWQSRGGLYYLPLLLMVVLATLLVGTKTSIIMGFVGLAALIAYMNRYVAIVIMLAGLIFVLEYSDILVDVSSSVYDVIFYRYSNSEDVLSFIFSNRDVYLYDAMDNFSVVGFNVLRLITGFGAFVSFRSPAEHYDGIDILESDLADLYFMYGVLSFLYFGFILFVLAKSVANRSYFLGFAFSFLAAHSMLAGHVIFNGMSGTMFSLLPALILSRSSTVRSSFSSFAKSLQPSNARRVAKLSITPSEAQASRLH
jgi:hypothetical protein